MRQRRGAWLLLVLFSVCRCLFFFNYYFPAGDVAAADIVIVAARIAFASGAAFAAAQLLDVTIFDRFRRAAWWLPPLASSMPSSLLDTALFFFLAFAYTDVPWLSLAIGDFAVKAAMAPLLLPSYRFIVCAWRYHERSSILHRGGCRQNIGCAAGKVLCSYCPPLP